MRSHMDFQHIVHFWNDNENLSMQKLGQGKAKVQYAPMIKFRFSKEAKKIFKISYLTRRSLPKSQTFSKISSIFLKTLIYFYWEHGI